MSKKSGVIIGIIIVLAVGASIINFSGRKVSNEEVNNLAEKADIKNNNPFKDLYNYFPESGIFQKCIKESLGEKFLPAYNGELVSEDATNAIQKCGNVGADFYDILPEKAQQCFRDALGEDLEKARKDASYKWNKDAEEKLKSCPAIQELNSKNQAIVRYVEERKAAKPADSGVTPAWFEIKELKNGEFVSTNLTSRFIKDAKVESNDSINSNIRISLTPEGRELFKEITGRNVGNKIAIYVDGVSVSEPMVGGAITDGSVIISGGSSSKEELELMAERLYVGRGLQNNPN